MKLLVVTLFAVLLTAQAAPNTFSQLDPFNVLSQFEALGQEKDEEILVTRSDDPVVTLSHGGQLLGKKKKLGVLGSYYSFKGIPYAEPPVGDLRFRAPVTHKGWSGIRNATSHGNECVQTGLVYGTNGDEDCLFLNVYSPNLNPKEKMAVMFWIHGGSFSSGSANTLIYGPENIIYEDVVLVSINYRLGFLGFFSTGDKYAPGNYGLKDAIEALKWVQKNIEAFGGDPEKVTIFGESAGSVLTHYLVLSPMSKGLFKSAISQSGTALSPWGLQEEPRERAFEVAAKMGISAKSTEEIVKELRKIEDTTLFAKETPGWLALDVPRGMTGFFFAPTIDPADSEEPIFLPDHPVTMMKNGDFNHIPYIVGSNSHESLFGIRELIVDPFLFSKFKRNPHLLIPFEWEIEHTSPTAYSIIQQIQDVYFKGTDVEDKMDYVNYCSDRHFHWGVYKTAELMHAKSAENIYSYIFTYDGALNLIKRVLLLGDYEGAMHADDIPYFFKLGGVPAPVLPGNHALTVRERLVKMWTNFAKTSDPTPEVNKVITTKWQPMGENHEYLEIGEELEAKDHPFGERMTMWQELDAKYSKR
ncbi:juvenile hormone esterase-like [Culicoides brevitarsis]|uniref:juvenile hormone esterase-like n=1 Tax=Culicoides brevitarsis TaxID=469753 RepID=UPI00307B8389